MKLRSKAAVLIAAILCTTGGALALATPALAATTTYVNCGSGSDSNSGSSGSPFKTLGHAVSVLSGSGNTINLQASSTWCIEQVAINGKNGTSSSHNKILGPETGLTKSDRYKAVLANTAGIALVINSNYWDVSGFTINGQPGYPDNQHTYTTSTSRAAVDSFKTAHQSNFNSTKLLYVGQAHSGTHDIHISDMWFSDSGGECVRFRENAHAILLEDSQIQYCGLFKKKINGYNYHNGEGVYVGTSPKSTGEQGFANDTTNNVTVQNNTIWTWGTECGEFKENEHDNLFTGNKCAHSEEPVTSSGSILETRGGNNMISNNTFENANDWGARVAADNGDTAGGNKFENNSWDGYTDAGAKDYISEGANVAGAVYCGNMATNPSSTFGGAAC